MGRRRRSLLGGKGKKKDEGGAPQSDDAPVDIEDALAKMSDDAISELVSDEGQAEDPDSGGLQSAVEEEALAESQAAEAIDAPETEEPPTELADDASPQYSEEETVMEDDGEDPFAEGAFVDELAGEEVAPVAPPPPEPEPESEPPVHPDVYIDEEAPTHDISVDEPSDPEPYEAPMAYPVGAGMDVGTELYDDFGDFDQAPPTEEVPASRYQDLSQSHAAPMNVPDAPSVPGIADRFTPPPAERTELGARYADKRPSYLAEPTPAPEMRHRLPESKVKGRFENLHEKPPTYDDDDDEDDYGEQGPGIGRYIVGVVFIVIICVGVVGGGVMMFGMVGGGADEIIEDVAEDATYKGVDRRKGIRKDTPELLGDLDEEGSAAEPAPAPEAEPSPAPAPEEAATAEPEPAPAPVAAPAPRPKPRPVAATSVIKVRSNRKVLIYVDGKAEGHTPIDVSVGVGAHEVMGMIRGRPDSKQTQSVTIEELGQSPSVSFTF